MAGDFDISDSMGFGGMIQFGGSSQNGFDYVNGEDDGEYSYNDYEAPEVTYGAKDHGYGGHSTATHGVSYGTKATTHDKYVPQYSYSGYGAAKPRKVATPARQYQAQNLLTNVAHNAHGVRKAQGAAVINNVVKSGGHINAYGHGYTPSTSAYKKATNQYGSYGRSSYGNSYGGYSAPAKTSYGSSYGGYSAPAKTSYGSYGSYGRGYGTPTSSYGRRW